MVDIVGEGGEQGPGPSVASSVFRARWIGTAAAVLALGAVVFSATLNFFSGLTGGAEGDLAVGGVGGLLLVLGAVVSTRGMRNVVRWPAAFFAILGAIYIVAAVRVPDAAGMKHLTQLIVLFGVFLYFSNVRLTTRTKFGLAAVAWLSLAILLVFAIWVHGAVTSYDFQPKNVLGGIMYYVVLLSGLLARRSLARWIVVPMVLTVALLVEQRMLFVLLVVLVAAYVFLSVVERKWIVQLVVFGAVAAVVMFVIGYTLPDPPKVYHSLDVALIHLTGRSLYSGRQRIWPLVVLKILQNPFLGHGAGATPSSLLGLDLSAHNLYLQVTLQVGLVGLAALLTLLSAIWLTFLPGVADKAVRFAAAAFLTIVLHEMAEVTLTQNAFAVGMLQWTFVGLGMASLAAYREGLVDRPKVESGVPNVAAPQ